MHYNFMTVSGSTPIDEQIGYLQFVIDCWHKSVCIGLPLVVILVLPLMVFDIITLVVSGLWYAFTRWGR